MTQPKENVVPLNRPKRFGEALGLWAGSLITPYVAIGSIIRQARIFHPRGVYFKAMVEPVEDLEPSLADLADGLSQGDALVRLSTGMWSMDRGVLPDTLGFSVRFNAAADAEFTAKEDSQDLLMVTSKRIITLPIAALMTKQHDFLANDYYGMGKYEVADRPNMWLRLRPLVQSSNSSPNRFEKIRTDVTSGDVVFILEASSRLEPSRWYPLVRIELQSEVTMDDRNTVFWPFRTGQGIRPQGFTQYLRPMNYLVSQWARGI